MIVSRTHARSWVPNDAGELMDALVALWEGAFGSAYAVWSATLVRATHVGFAIGLVLALVAWWVTARTAAGFRARAVGDGMRAAVSAGRVDAARTVTWVFLVSGACAGIAGASEVGGVTWALYEGISPGYGYTAIAVALLARLDARWVIVSAVFFGALEAGAAAMQRNAGVPSVAVQVIVGVVVLAVLAGARLHESARVRRRTVHAEGL